MSLRDIALRAGKNTAAAAFMPVKAGVDGAKAVGHQIIDPYSPATLLRQFKYHSGLAIVESLFKQSRDSLFGKDKTVTPKNDPAAKAEKNDEKILFEVRNTNTILGKVTEILEATQALTRSIFGLELKAANENKNKAFDNLEKYREGKNFNVGVMGIGGAANAANSNNMPAPANGNLGDDIATGVGAGIGSRLAIGAIAGAIGGAILGSLKKIFNVGGLVRAFSKIGLLGGVLSGIGAGLLGGIGRIFSLGKFLPLLTKLAWPAAIVASIGSGIMDGWNKYMETGDLAASISTGLTSSLDFLTFGLFSAIKDAAGSWLTGNQIVNPTESNEKIDLAREQLLNGEITQEQYDAALATHEEELKKYDEFMAPVDNAIAGEALGMPDVMAPPVLQPFNSSDNLFSPEPKIFDPMDAMPWGITPPVAPAPTAPLHPEDPVPQTGTPHPSLTGTPVLGGSDAGGDKPPLTIVIEGSNPDDPWHVKQGGNVLLTSPGHNPIYNDNVTAPAPTTPQQSAAPTIVNQNNVTNNNGGGGSGTQQYRHTPISTTPNHQSKWENNWLTSD